jgi:molecular chaperone HscB
MNYFELFDLPVSLVVDKQGLSKKYFELQKKYHPDFYTQEGEEDQADALERSSMINRALKVLQQPDQTIKYVLQLKGLLEDEEKFSLPQDFLMEMLELNEKLVEEDPADFRKEVDALEIELYDEVKHLVETYDEKTTTTEDLLKVKEYYFKKKYLHRILDRLDD